MSTAQLYIVMYKPRQGNYEHWALYLEHGTSHTIYQVVGQHPNFQKNADAARPQDSNNFKRSFQVGTINVADLSALQQEISKAKVDNETIHWNCQDYVVELVEQFVEECLIDEEDWKKVKKSVHKHFGPL